jgi:hypothetical protein
MPLPFARAALACAALTLAAVAAPAQAPKRDAADPAAPVAAATYRSAFAGYRRLADPTPADWKGANETVERIGGWRAYAREASAPAAASAPAPAHRH